MITMLVSNKSAQEVQEIITASTLDRLKWQSYVKQQLVAVYATFDPVAVPRGTATETLKR